MKTYTINKDYLILVWLSQRLTPAEWFEHICTPTATEQSIIDYTRRRFGIDGLRGMLWEVDYAARILDEESRQA